LKRIFLIVIMVFSLNLVLTGTAFGAGVQVTSVKDTGGGGGTEVYLSWNAYAGAATYRVLRGVNGISWDSSFDAGAALFYEDTSVTDHYTNYYYKVLAFDGLGQQVSSSDKVRAFPQVNMIKGTASSGGTGVALGWDAFMGAASYTLLRSTDGVAWNSVGSTTAGTLTYDDTSITNYVNYYYEVRALDGSSAVLATSPVARAYPPMTSPHDNFLTNQDVCASCHVTHTAKSAKLNVTVTTSELCETCHDGTQSKYDEQDGKVKLDSTPTWGDSPAGPFGDLGRVRQVTPAVNPTSSHNLQTAVNDAPGSNTSASFNVGCSSCHDPHNKSNYRNLRVKIDTTSSPTVTIQIEAYAVTTSSGETVNYVDGTVSLCGSCHSDFNQGTGSGHTPASGTQQVGFALSAGSTGSFMHPVGVPVTNYPNADTNNLPLEGSGRKVVCLTCHKAHGTTALGANQTKSGALSTVLKRLDNAAMCEDCHKK